MRYYIAMAMIGALAGCTGAAENIKDSDEANSVAVPSDSTPSPRAPSGVLATTLVKALASKNPSPDAEGNRGSASVPENFDWSEQERVWAVIGELMDRSEEVWPELVEHLDDEDYCITIEVFNGAIHDWPVGIVCQEIIERNLSEAYYRKLEPQSLEVYRKLRSPRFEIELKDWCEQRKDLKLYELQIEACEWAMKELSKDDEFPRTSAEQRKEWIASVETEIASLKKSKQAVPYKGFGVEEIVPIRNPDKVDDPFADR
jgi:hypothetical protein